MSRTVARPATALAPRSAAKQLQLRRFWRTRGARIQGPVQQRLRVTRQTSSSRGSTNTLFSPSRSRSPPNARDQPLFFLCRSHCHYPPRSRPTRSALHYFESEPRRELRRIAESYIPRTSLRRLGPRSLPARLLPLARCPSPSPGGGTPRVGLEMHSVAHPLPPR